MPRLLLIAYYFPPWGMGGVQRVAKFARYLPEFGWDVTVIAPEATGYIRQDPSLLDELPASVRIERIPVRDRAGAMAPEQGVIRRLGAALSRWRDLPDRHKGFARLAVTRARQLMADNPFDVVLTSSPPPSIHLAGLALRDRAVWIADFRDPWRVRPDDYGPTLVHRLRNSGLHHRVLTSADAVVAVTPELAAHFQSLAPNAVVHSIRNGFDEADFDGLTAPAPRAQTTALFPGTFSRLSDPRPALRALAVWRKQNPSQSLRIVHTGATLDVSLATTLAETGLADIYDDRGYLDHRRAVAALLAADLLVIAHTDPDAAAVSVPGRIYEMLRAGRPILALAFADSALANLLRDQPACAVVAPHDRAAAVAAIERLLAGPRQPLRAPEALAPLARRNQTGRLSDLARQRLSARKGGGR
ncbi:MAG TPA: glycosyltransferase [bacterium]|nr:glycosyltransferase [bacterium]